MSGIRRSLSTLVFLVVCGFQPAAAQVLPGPRPVDRDLEHRRFVLEALQGVRELMREWQSAVADKDASTVASYYTDGAMVHLWDGEPYQGRATIEEGLRELLPRINEIETVMSDFTASGLLFYGFGRFWCRPDGAAAGSVTGTYVLIAERDHRRWRIRSQLFRTDPPAS